MATDQFYTFKATSDCLESRSLIANKRSGDENVFSQTHFPSKIITKERRTLGKIL